MTTDAARLRVSEVVALKVADIDRERMLIRIERGKDRYALLTERLLVELRAYWRGETRSRSAHSCLSRRRSTGAPVSTCLCSLLRAPRSSSSSRWSRRRAYGGVAIQAKDNSRV